MAEKKSKTINDRLRDVQCELKAPKGQFNKFGGYKYRSCEDILEAAKPVLKKHGLTLTLNDAIVEVGGRIYVRARAMVTDGMTSISTDAYAREAESKKGMDSSQITGTASSYARKYALNGLFLIDDTKDADSNEQHRQAQNAPKQAAPKAEKAAAPAPKAEKAPEAPAGKIFAGFFAISATLALGFMGAMVQSNSIAETFTTAFGVPGWIVGLVVAIKEDTIVLETGTDRRAGMIM